MQLLKTYQGLPLKKTPVIRSWPIWSGWRW